MANFPFNQKNTTDCGWRCVYFILSLKGKLSCDLETFKKWFNGLNPNVDGMYFLDIYRIFNYYKVDYSSSFPTLSGSYLIYFQSGEVFGHYIIYKDGMLYDPVLDSAKQISLEELQKKIEINKKPLSISSFVCLKII